VRRKDLFWVVSESKLTGFERDLDISMRLREISQMSGCVSF
jgi:hypothetical protein